MTYPSQWRKPNPRKPKSLQSRITETQKSALFARTITTRDLAKELQVHEKYLSHMFAGKEATHDKKPLIEARKAYKLAVAVEVLEGKYTIQQAADIVYCSYNTMQRFVQKAKEAKPDLVATYEDLLKSLRQENIKKVRNVRQQSSPTT